MEGGSPHLTLVLIYVTALVAAALAEVGFDRRVAISIQLAAGAAAAIATIILGWC